MKFPDVKKKCPRFLRDDEEIFIENLDLFFKKKTSNLVFILKKIPDEIRENQNRNWIPEKSGNGRFLKISGKF